MKAKAHRCATILDLKRVFGVARKQVEAGKVLRITVGRWSKKRSLSQNAYLWSVVYALMAEETGHTAEEIHEACKRLFLPPQTIEIGDRVVDVPASTTRLTTVEFQDYIEQCSELAASELGIHIPQPGEAA